MEELPDQPGSKPSPGLLDLLAMGLSSALFIGGGLVLGVLIADWAGTGSALTFVGLGFGVVLAVAATVHQVRKYL
jgi:hypothetical protein